MNCCMLFFWLQKGLRFLYILGVFFIKSRRKRLLIMENHSQFRFPKKATKLWRNLQLVLKEIVAFLENLNFSTILYIFSFKSRRKMRLIMENHTQKMLLNRNATSLGALLKKYLKACRTSWKCKNMFPLEGVANRNRK